MRVGVGRFAVLLAVLALLVRGVQPVDVDPRRRRARTAVASEQPSGPAHRAGVGEPAAADAAAGERVAGEARRRRRSAGTAASARVTRPSRSQVERKVADDFNASHPGIHLQFEGYVYAAAADALSVQLGSGSGPDVVGPVGVGGAERFKGQWLDLQPYIDKAGIDMSQFPESTVKLYNAGGEGQLGIPYAVYPSVLFYKADMFKEAGLNEPPHEWNGTYTMPDGSTRPWDYDTVARDRQDPDRRRERQRRDRRRSSIPTKIVQWGFEPQRDDLRQTGAYFGAGALLGRRTARPRRCQIRGSRRGSQFYDGIWTDHVEHDRRRSSRPPTSTRLGTPSAPARSR